MPKRLRWRFPHQPRALDTPSRVWPDAIERHLRTQCDAADPNAQGGAGAFIHRFGSALNTCTHFHVCATDGLVEAHGEGVRFQSAPASSPDAIETVQATIRQRTPRPRWVGWNEAKRNQRVDRLNHGWRG
ncbi:MAG: transposase [Anaerolineales bacterium]|nr:transposase [Anaerolineales bacterium]